MTTGGVAVVGRDEPWHSLPLEQAEALLGTKERGLSQARAAERLARYGPNPIREAPPLSNLLILVHQFRSPLIAILLLAGAVTVLLRAYVDAGAIAACRIAGIRVVMITGDHAATARAIGRDSGSESGTGTRRS